MKTGEPSAPLRVADVGTGSGCLAVALAHELPHAHIFATDISGAAIEVARRNAERSHVSERVDFVQTDLLEALLASGETHDDESGRFDLIVSNPPYVGLADAPTLPREVREHEPHAALFAGETGAEIYGRLIEQAKCALKERGILTLELGYNTADHALKIVREQTGWANVSITKDLAGIPRVLAAERLT